MELSAVSAGVATGGMGLVNVMTVLRPKGRRDSTAVLSHQPAFMIRGSRVQTEIRIHTRCVAVQCALWYNSLS